MNYINRDISLITGKKNLEHLYTFKNFPVFMGCTDNPINKDIKADMSFSICKDTGIIQLDKLLPLDVVYQNQHNDGVGKIWQDHYLAFSKFLGEFEPKKILEIGGANDFVANNFLNDNPDSEWTVVEPHPQFVGNKKIKVIKDWFDESFEIDEEIDTVIHSHVLEHTYDPVSFINHISSFLKVGQKHIFTFPNMVQQLSKKYTNCLNFEHTAFLAEPFVDYILEKSGFKIIKKHYFQDHSIFYSTEKGQTNASFSISNKYSEYKKLFTEYIDYHVKLICEINTQINNFDGDVYLFGAHIFSQYLLKFGLNQRKMCGVLDNSESKMAKRLYGTNLIVLNPEIIRGKNNVAVILKIGAYRDEVFRQLKDINPNVTIFE